MKKTLAIFVIAGCIQGTIYAQLAVHDPTNFLVLIEQVYVAYDQVMNTLQQIKYTYDQLQHYYREARTWQLDEIRWDGDWDFRNEIRSVTSSVNRQITNMRMIEYNLNEKQIVFGGQSFTLKDLIDPQYMGAMLEKVETENLRRAAAGFEGRLTEQEKAAVWRKYGLSPRNYYFVRAKQNEVQKLMKLVTAWGMEESIRENLEAVQERNRLITENAMSEDNTEKSLLQQQIVQTGILLEEIQRMEALLAQNGAMIAMQQQLENQEKEAEIQQRETVRLERERKNNPGTLF